MRIRWKMWGISFLWSLALLVLFGWWHAGFDGFVINRAFADAGFILIGLSFALSGICYFFKVRWLAHRKYLGVVGFFLILVHGVLSLVLFTMPHFFKPRNVLPFIFAVIAILFFAWLAVISTDYWMRRLKQDWRKWLRAGYVAFVFGTAHFIILYWQSWTYWFNTFDGFPEPSLVLAVFGVLTMLLRLALYLKIKK